MNFGKKIIVSFPGSWKTRTGFSQPRIHTVMDRTSARRARVTFTYLLRKRFVYNPLIVGNLIVF